MPTIYKRSKGGVDYYSSTAVAPPKGEVDALDKIRHHMTDEAYAEALENIRSQADSGDEVGPSFDSLKAVSGRYDFLSLPTRETRSAQIDMTVMLLNEKVSNIDAHIEAIKQATGEKWSNLRKWCDEPDNRVGQKKSGKLRVPTDIARAIDDKVAEGQEKHAKRQATAKANKNSGS
jgi:hypothetical protein